MLAVLLGILKAIGMILLVLILVLVLVGTAILFIPIRYNAKGVLSEEKKFVNLRITWFCKIVRMKLEYNPSQKLLISLKVLCFELLREKKRKNTKLKKEKVPRSRKQNETYHSAINAALLEDAENMEATIKTEVENKQEELVDEKPIPENKSETEPENKIQKIIFKFQALYDKISKVIQRIGYYIDIFEEKETRGLIANAWSSIQKIWNNIKPKVLNVNMVFGFDIPDTTGKIYGYYCMLMPWLGDDIYIEPDFEQKTLSGDFFLKGKITVFTILVNGLKILFDKRLKPLMNKLKNGGKKE